MKNFFFFGVLPILISGLIVFRGHYLPKIRSFMSQLILMFVFSLIYLWLYSVVIWIVMFIAIFLITGAWGNAVKKINRKQDYN